MKRIHFGILLILAAYIGIAATSGHGAKPNDEGFKNLKVLPKDISEDKLDSIMRSFSLSLGVRCSFCHARSADTTSFHLDFASDARPDKDVARYMMHMTTHIDTAYFNYNHSTRLDTIRNVICYTCHRGAFNPGLLANQLDSLTKVNNHK